MVYFLKMQVKRKKYDPQQPSQSVLYCVICAPNHPCLLPTMLIPAPHVLTYACFPTLICPMYCHDFVQICFESTQQKPDFAAQLHVPTQTRLPVVQFLIAQNTVIKIIHILHIFGTVVLVIDFQSRITFNTTRDSTSNTAFWHKTFTGSFFSSI